MAKLDAQLLPAVAMLGTEVVKAEKQVSFAVTPTVTADDLGVLTLPAGARVLALTANVKTAEGGVATLDVGIRGGSATQFLSNVDANATGVTHSTSPDYLNTSGAEEIIEISPDNDLANAEVQLIAVYAISELSF